MESAIDTLTQHAENCKANAPIHEAAGDLAQAELDRRLAQEYLEAARHLKAVMS
jgi:hypothetical protein